MIHWHSLLTQRSPQQGAFPGKTSGPLFVDATLLIQLAAWFRKHHGKAGQNLLTGHVGDAGQRFDGRACLAFPAFAVLPHQDVDAEAN